MKTKLLTPLLLFLVILTLTGCKTSLSYTYSVETGDKVEVKLNTSDGLKMTMGPPFVIKDKDGTELVRGFFAEKSKYDQFEKASKTDPASTRMDDGTKDGNPYFAWDIKDKEYNYAVLLKGEKTAIILQGLKSRAESERVFNNLTFTVK